MIMKRHSIFIAGALLAALAAASCTKQGPEDTSFIFRKTTIAEFNLQAPDDNYYYYLEGTIGEITDEASSHFMLSDGTGEVLVNGLWQGPHGKRIRNMGDYRQGDAILIAALKGKFAAGGYAKDAYVVDPEAEKMWVTPVNAEISADGGEIELKVFGGNNVSVAASESWIVPGTPAGGTVPVTVEPNGSIRMRYGYVNVRSDDITVRVKIVQEAFVPQTLKISEALYADYARVEGTVVAIADDGYLLSDGTGVIFIDTEKFSGIYAGATVAVTGGVETADYMTRIVPELVSATESEPVKLPSPREIGADEIDGIISAALAKDASEAGSLSYEFVKVSGTIVFAEGRMRLVSGGRTINAEPYGTGGGLDFDSLNGHVLELDGYVISVQDGMLKIMLTGYEDIPVKSLITVDGEYSDWAELPDLAPGNDMSASHNLKPVVKLHYENGYVYGYFRVDKSEENGGYSKEDSQYLLKIAGRFYVWIDNDDISEGQGGGWLFSPQRYDNVICYRITRTAGGWDGWSTVEPRANEYYGVCAVGNSHTDNTDDKTTVGYMATTARKDILEGEFSFLAAKVGLYGREKAVIGLEIGWDNGFNTGSASLGKKGYEIELLD